MSFRAQQSPRMFSGHPSCLPRLRLFSSPPRAYSVWCQGPQCNLGQEKSANVPTVNAGTMNTYTKVSRNTPRMRTYRFSALKPSLESTLAEISGGAGPRRIRRHLAHVPANHLESHSCIKTQRNSHGITLLQKKWGVPPAGRIFIAILRRQRHGHQELRGA